MRLLRRARRFLLVACACCWLAAFVATHTPLASLPMDLPSDKVLHFAGYFALSVMLLVTMISYGSSRLRRIGTVICGMSAYAAIDELTQPLVNRHAAFSDWSADVAGVIAAVILLEAFLRFWERRRLRRSKA